MKLEKLNFDLPEMPSLNIDDVISRFISEQQKKEEELFTSALRICVGGVMLNRFMSSNPNKQTTEFRKMTESIRIMRNN